jgi:hypothetical protein
VTADVLLQAEAVLAEQRIRALARLAAVSPHGPELADAYATAGFDYDDILTRLHLLHVAAEDYGCPVRDFAWRQLLEVAIDYRVQCVWCGRREDREIAETCDGLEYCSTECHNALHRDAGRNCPEGQI